MKRGIRVKNECICGKLVRGRECEHCGRVYTIDKEEYIEDKEQTRKNIKKFIIENTTVLKHSSWGCYYDFPIASKETIEAYTKDVNRHRECAKEHLKKFDETYLVELRNQIEQGIGGDFLADRILTSLGYKYREEQQRGVTR